MAWTAQLVTKSTEMGKAYVTVKYISPSPPESFQETYSVEPDLEWLKAWVKSRCDLMDAKYAFIAALVLNVGSTFDTTPTVDAVKAAKEAFIADLAQLKAFRVAIAANLKQANDADVVALIQKIKAAYALHPEYAALLGAAG